MSREHDARREGDVLVWRAPAIELIRERKKKKGEGGRRGGQGGENREPRSAPGRIPSGSTPSFSGKEKKKKGREGGNADGNDLARHVRPTPATAPTTLSRRSLSIRETKGKKRKGESKKRDGRCTQHGGNALFPSARKKKKKEEEIEKLPRR